MHIYRNIQLVHLSKARNGLLSNLHSKCDVKKVMFTFLSEKSHIHPGLWGLSTSWQCMADSRTLEWKVLPSHKDCSWSTTVPVQLRMPRKRSGTKDMSVEQIGLFSVKHKAFVITHLWQLENVTIPLLFWKATSSTHVILQLPKFQRYGYLSLLQKVA